MLGCLCCHCCRRRRRCSRSFCPRPSAAAYLHYDAVRSRDDGAPWLTRWRQDANGTQSCSQMRSVFPALAKLFRAYTWERMSGVVAPILQRLQQIAEATTQGDIALDEASPAMHEDAWTCAPW